MADDPNFAPPDRKKWEYLVEYIPSGEVSERLNALGQDGWDLVHFTSPNTWAVLKRPIQRQLEVYGSP